MDLSWWTLAGPSGYCGAHVKSILSGHEAIKRRRALIRPLLAAATLVAGVSVLRRLLSVRRAVAQERACARDSRADKPPANTEGSTDERSLDQPRADASSRYHATLEQSAESYPLVTEALMRSDRHRPRRWQQFIDSVDLQAIELLLNFLMSTSTLLEKDSGTRDLAFIPTRLADDVRVSLEGLLSGYFQVSSDAMRDIIETELLIRDFTLDQEQIGRWRNATERVLRNEFRAGQMRSRQANALGIPISDVPGTTDHHAHSRLLHPGPPLLFERSPESGHQAIHVLDTLSDVIFHGNSAAQALGSFLDAINRPIPNLDPTLAALKLSGDDLNRARAAVKAIANQAAESLSAKTVFVFENGLLIAISQDAGRADFFNTNRIDFRRFHRDVSAEQSASRAAGASRDYGGDRPAVMT
jgi:hypothetical protein